MQLKSLSQPGGAMMLLPGESSFLGRVTLSVQQYNEDFEDEKSEGTVMCTRYLLVRLSATLCDNSFDSLEKKRRGTLRKLI